MKKLSIRKYAVTIGVSHWAVGKAIRAGHIKKGFDKKIKKIKVDVANQEWGNATKEKHKRECINEDNKPVPQHNVLTTAFINYCKAHSELLHALEQELRYAANDLK